MAIRSKLKNRNYRLTRRKQYLTKQHDTETQVKILRLIALGILSDFVKFEILLKTPLML